MDAFLFINAAMFGGIYAILQQVQSRVLDLYAVFQKLARWVDDSLPNDSGIPGALQASVLVPLTAWGISIIPELGYMAPSFPTISFVPGSVLMGVVAFGAHIAVPGYWPIFNTLGKSAAEFYKDFFDAFLPAVLALFI